MHDVSPDIAWGHCDELPRNFDSGWHRHDHHQLLYSSAGTLRLEVEGAQWLLPPRRAAWITGGLSHRVYSTQGASLRTVYFPTNETMIPTQPCCVFGVDGLCREMLIYATRWSADRNACEVDRRYFSALAALTHEWAQATPSLRLPAASSPPLRRAVHQVLETLEAPLTMEALAKQVGISARTLRRYSRRELGMGWGDFTQAARMIAAQEHLSDPTLSITDVAFAVGFESLAAFSRAFRRFTGASPREFRKGITAPSVTGQ